MCDFHTITLNQYEFMQDMLDRGKQLQETDPQTIYYIEAFIDDRLQWTEWAADEEERELLIRDAVAAGFTYTVETEVQ
tara:strand:- start:209 stop:442 length:234 start_codon:yes stop_codon:yes gene_type:complete